MPERGRVLTREHYGRAVYVNGVAFWQCWCGRRWLPSDDLTGDRCPALSAGEGLSGVRLDDGHHHE